MEDEYSKSDKEIENLIRIKDQKNKENATFI